MLLTLIINSLNSTILLIAIQNQKPVFESPRRQQACTTMPPCSYGCVNTVFNRNFGFRKESQTFKRMALIVILSIR